MSNVDTDTSIVVPELKWPLSEWGFSELKAKASSGAMNETFEMEIFHSAMNIDMFFIFLR